MPYRTLQHPFLSFSFNPFSHSSSLSYSSPSSSVPLQQGMECVQEPVKGGFGAETALMDDFCGGAGDDFFVDELLDFSNGFSETEEPPAVVAEEAEVKAEQKVSQEKETTTAPPPPAESGALSGKDEFGSLPESELTAEAEGLESLEWLSHFVEDSFSDYSLTGKFPPKPAEKAAEPVHEQQCFMTPVQTKARTKRARSGVRVWPVLSPSLTESSTSSSSSASSTTSFPPSSLRFLQSQTGLLPAPAKKLKRKPADGGGAGGGGAAQPRRCSHCGVTKTPQWRAGPLGSKTLCNACGVRYKSGRLLPEYRPACSPTYSSDLHSNNHRKVLEMRRKKEVETEPAGLPPPVQSF